MDAPVFFFVKEDWKGKRQRLEIPCVQRRVAVSL